MTAEDALPAEPLGPGSLFWELTGDWRTMLIASRALAFQTAYPAVGAGVGEHSVYKTDPYGRLDRTFRSVMAQTYGGPGSAEEGRRLRELHRDIKGVDAKGRRYSALNPEAYLWVHATIYESSLVFMERFLRPLTDREKEQLFDEWRRMGLLLYIPEQVMPRTVAEFWEMWERLSARLENNQVVQDVLFNPPRPPKYVPRAVTDALTRPLLKLQRDVVAWTVPDDLRELFGLAPLTSREVAHLRRVAGVARLVGRVLPEPLRYMPMAYVARRRAMARHATDASYAA